MVLLTDYETQGFSTFSGPRPRFQGPKMVSMLNCQIQNGLILYCIFRRTEEALIGTLIFHLQIYQTYC